MIELGVFHNGASDLPVKITSDGVAINDGDLRAPQDSAVRTQIDQIRQGVLAEQLGVPLVTALHGYDVTISDEAMSRTRLGRAYLEAGRVGEAIAIFEPLLADQERTHGPEHIYTLCTCRSLARAYLVDGRSDDAERLLTRAGLPEA